MDFETFLVGECNTGAGGEGGPLGIFLLILKKKKIQIYQYDLINCITVTKFIE